MWNESEHPRDDIGRFTEKGGGGYEGLKQRRNELRHVWVERRNLTLPPTLENYQAIVEKMGSDEGIEYLDYNDFRSTRLTKEELLQRIESNKALYEQAKKEKEEKERIAQEQWAKKVAEEKAERQRKIDRIKSNGEISDTVADKLIEVVNRSYDAYEKAMSNQRYGDTSRSGYVGHSRSERATEAETNGKFPAGRAANILGITSLKLKKYMRPSEWHHTGALYNATDYYDISDLCNIAEDLQEEDGFEDIRKDYSAESIELFEKIYGVKIK